MRYFLDISYDGGPYHGWQKQENALSVQEVVENGISTVLKEKLEITGSGRTDTGVHAVQQIAHFDYNQDFDKNKLIYNLNSLLDKTISINHLQKVNNNAHARFDAISRTYKYYIHQKKDPFLITGSYYFKPDLDLEKISNGCKIIKDWKDFESFSKVKTEVNNFLCEIIMARWEEQENGYIFTVKANRFLRGMVRAMVGTLIDIGQSKLSADEFALILASRNRSDAGSSVPSEGLFLTEVRYPKEIYIQK